MQTLKVGDRDMEHLCELVGKKQLARRTAPVENRANIGRGLDGFTNPRVHAVGRYRNATSTNEIVEYAF
ncbi:hypothetical protein OIU93_20435 [Paeniglutamicibacter sp. ZC-3]|uniref:hypothetical protein n=1 Tax=Paeniglutamicibacter sp. ZC-3 TaxID=2986919 RepID=UPI0021F74183|nr:hypothetical protein [Paeniglutamicibacter sp. ZC-3]MCV9996617.1 hypothetical protein [Paeniglutamicibacter sp. ZC-3]